MNLKNLYGKKLIDSICNKKGNITKNHYYYIIMGFHPSNMNNDKFHAGKTKPVYIEYNERYHPHENN